MFVYFFVLFRNIDCIVQNDQLSDLLFIGVSSKNTGKKKRIVSESERERGEHSQIHTLRMELPWTKTKQEVLKYFNVDEDKG